MEADIINLFGFTFIDVFKWGKIFIQDHPNYTLEKLDKHFASNSKL
jgi:hypothetical protein